MAKKEYETSEDYKNGLQILLNRIKQREKFAEDIKNEPPGRRAELLARLSKFDENTEKLEKSLAEEYELTQKLGRLKEEQEERLTKLEETCDRILEDMEKKAPEIYAKFIADLYDDQGN